MSQAPHPRLLKRQLRQHIQRHNTDFRELLEANGALEVWQSLIKAERSLSEEQAKQSIAYQVRPQTVIEKTREMNLLSVVDLLLSQYPELLSRWQIGHTPHE